MGIQNRLHVLLTILALSVANCLAADEPERTTDVYGDPLPAGAVARLGTVRFRSGEYMRRLAFSPDGKRLVTRGTSKMTLWDAESGKKLAEFASDKVGPFAWRSDGRGVMLVTEPGGKERIGDFTRERLKAGPTKEFAYEPNAAAKVNDFEHFHGHAISPDGRYLVAGRSGNRDEQPRPISVWEIDTSRPLEEFEQIHELGPQQGNCLQILFSPESKFVGVVSGPKIDRAAKDQTLLFVLYDLATGKERYSRPIPLPHFQVTSALTVALAPEARYLAVGGSDSVCHIYALERDGAEITVDDPAEQPNRWFALVFAGEQLFACRAGETGARYFDSSLHVFDAKTGRSVRDAVSLPSYVDAMTLSTDGKRLAISMGGALQIYDVTANRSIEPAAGHLSWIWGLHVFADGAKALTWSYGDEPRVWELATGKELKRLPLPAQKGHWVVSPDEKAILGLIDGKLRVFDAASGEARSAPGALASATGNALHRAEDGRSIITSDEAWVTIWDWPDGRLRAKFELQRDAKLAQIKVPRGLEPQPFQLTPDGRVLISRGLLDLSTWEVESGVHGTLWRGNTIRYGERALALVGDGTRIAFSGTFSTQTNPGGIAGDEDGPLIGFGGKGKKVAGQALPAAAKKKAAGGDFGVQPGNFAQGGFGGAMKQASMPTSINGMALWDLRTGKMLHLFESIQGDVYRASPRDIAADPGGFVIAIMEEIQSDPGSIVLYEVATGQIRRRIFSGTRETAALAFTPDGKRLVTVSHDTTGLVWDVSLLSVARGRKPAAHAELEQAWKALAEPSARAAYDGQLALASNPLGAVELLQQRLRPVPIVGAATFDRIVADLEDEKFLTRERAASELDKLGRIGVVAIRARALKAQSREAKLRLTQYLERYDSPKLTADELRSVRALEFLNHVATSEARDLIAELAKGESTADLTIRALSTKTRLERR